MTLLASHAPVPAGLTAAAAAADRLHCLRRLSGPLWNETPGQLLLVGFNISARRCRVTCPFGSGGVRLLYLPSSLFPHKFRCLSTPSLIVNWFSRSHYFESLTSIMTQKTSSLRVLQCGLHHAP